MSASPLRGVHHHCFNCFYGDVRVFGCFFELSVLGDEFEFVLLGGCEVG